MDYDERMLMIAVRDAFKDLLDDTQYDHERYVKNCGPGEMDHCVVVRERAEAMVAQLDRALRRPMYA